MKVIIDGNVYDAEITPVVIIWDLDEQRKESGQHISGMEDRLPADDGPRFYAMYPINMDGHAIMDEARKKYEEYMGKPIAMTW